MLKLDLGAGAVSPEGFTPLGRAHNSEIYPLPYEDASVDVIRASHVLEHFGGGETVEVLTHWVSKLKPGGTMKIAVPDFKWVAEHYLKGDNIPVQGYVMGGQVDADDHHKAIFDDECLSEAMRLAGLIDIVKWKSELSDDCAALPVSLNLEGTKPRKREVSGKFKVSAVMSVPRLGFMDNFFCAFEALGSTGIKLRRHMGAYWEACLERTLTATIEEDQPDAILTIDYDTVYTQAHVEKLIKIMQERPEVDALAPIQSARHSHGPMLTMDMPLGVSGYDRLPPGAFADDITRLKTAHFGLTLIRTSSLLKLPKPWLWSQPAPDKTWGEGRVDADIYFWKQWNEAGLKLFSANRVVVGHLELMILWPSNELKPIFQVPHKFQTNGLPDEVWK